MGDQCHAEDLAGEHCCLRGVLGDLDASAFAASPGVDLRLHHDASSNSFSRLFRVSG